MNDDLPFDGPLTPEEQDEHARQTTTFDEFARWLSLHWKDGDAAREQDQFVSIAARHGFDAETARKHFESLRGSDDDPEEGRCG